MNKLHFFIFSSSFYSLVFVEALTCGGRLLRMQMVGGPTNAQRSCLCRGTHSMLPEVPCSVGLMSDDLQALFRRGCLPGGELRPPPSLPPVGAPYGGLISPLCTTSVGLWSEAASKYTLFPSYVMQI